MTKEEKLYKMLSNFTHIMYCVSRDYKPFVAKDLEMQISEVYESLYPNELRDWSCPSCVLYNWKLFQKFYNKYQKKLSENGKKETNKD